MTQDAQPQATDTRTPSEIAKHFLETFFGNEKWKAKGLTATVEPQMEGQSISFTSGERTLDNVSVQRVFSNALLTLGIRNVRVTRAGENKIRINDADVLILQRELDANNVRAESFSAAVIDTLSTQGASVVR